MITRLVMVMTADGVIAKNSDHNPMDWTSAEDKALYQATSKKAGVTVMGQSTYDAIGSPLPGRLNVVLTKEERKDIPNELEHMQGEPEKILEHIKSRGFEMCLISGGTFVNSMFLEANLIDEIQITLEPKLFGSGLRLFDKIDINKNLELIEFKKLNDNTINLIYKVIH